jgi:hypothetical protein
VRNSPSALVWPYPLSRPSRRFNYFNDYVRALDVRFAGLPTVTQGYWDRYGRLYPWAKWCLEWLYDYDPIRPDIPGGVAAYRNYNCNQLIQGRGVTDEPPEIATRPDGDTVTVFGSFPLLVVWGGRSVEPEGEFIASVRECSLNHEPESGPNVSRLRWSFSAPIEYGAPMSVAACFTNRPGADKMPALAVGVSISDVDGVTFGAGRVTFLRPYT